MEFLNDDSLAGDNLHNQDIMKSSTSDLDKKSRMALFEGLSSLDYDAARSASRMERKELGKEREGTLTYGEVPIAAMQLILDKVLDIREDFGVKNRDFSSEVFVDLGSGAGRPCLAAASLYVFKKCVGIEILKSLHDQGVAAVKEYQATIDGSLEVDVTKEVQLYHGSIFDLELYDWVGVKGIILANSTCFSKEMFASIADLAANTHPDNIIVTFSEDLDGTLPAEDRRFELICCQNLKMSWGNADIFYHRLKSSV